MKNKIVLLCLVACSAQASLVKINPELTFIPHRLGKLELFHEGNEFKVLKNNKVYTVENYSLNKPLRDIDSKQLSKILLYSKLHVSEFGADEFQIESMGQLKGGGPVMASALYWLTKSCCWGAVGLASTAVVGGAIASAVGTGGASVAVPLATAATGASTLGLGVLKMGIGTAMVASPSVVGTVLVVSSPVIATIAVPLAATTITGAAMGAAAASPAVAAVVLPAATATTVALATGAAGTGLGLVAGIEVASCSAYALGMLFPWF